VPTKEITKQFGVAETI